ncbi:SigE family RNA polymerase sigma factor [Plantactinospora sp. S1510]|uniref:SigE family RNA polymerase sigma factor n=1 Tax=Plantactinospora alkalitolerans TaxID=2789879 RepID=A0ABS0GWM6_9ACTN|nr:SigE family RNA polymerase sigma factor [Plantactinospora alkalitolerans]MBF9130612.1 SigE family RNA polymerase sigma factor [Plantactinospora alkalitolerans]
MNADLEREFSEFVEARSHALFRTALALTGHRQQAEDLLQTVLARGARHWTRIRTGTPEAYLRTALYREQVSWWRSLRRRREVSAAQVPEVAATADDTATVDLHLALRQALAHLAPKHRAVLVLRYFEDRPDSEIAEILHCTESTVRSQAARALARLRDLCPKLEILTIPKEAVGR